MTDSSTVYAKRPWIPAERSFAAQPQALEAMVSRLTEQLSAVQLKRPGRVVIVGIGASHAAAGSAVYRLRAAGIDASRLLPSELPAGSVPAADLVVLISQSGRSAEVVDLARRVDAAAGLAITNYHPSPLGDSTERRLDLGNLDDSSVSFVSFTGTMLALGMLADAWTGELDESHWRSIIERSSDACAAAEPVLGDIADAIVARPSVDFVAPAPITSVAEEAALMFREGPRIVATAMETRLYLHGPMDSAGDTAHVVFGGEREAVLIEQLSEQSGTLVFVTASGQPRPARGNAHVIELPVALDEGVEFSIAATFITQRLTLLAAERRGIDINEPVFERLDTKVDRAADAS